MDGRSGTPLVSEVHRPTCGTGELGKHCGLPAQTFSCHSVTFPPKNVRPVAPEAGRILIHHPQDTTKRPEDTIVRRDENGTTPRHGGWRRTGELVPRAASCTPTLADQRHRGAHSSVDPGG